jgi:phosphatidate cytidylyltransferase
MLAGLLVNKYLYALLVLFMIAVMLHEFYGMNMGIKLPVQRVLAIFTALCGFILVFCVNSFHLPLHFAALIFVPLSAVMISSLYVKDTESFDLYSYIYTGILYIAVPLVLSNYIVFDREGNFNGLLMLCFFIIIWASDVGAYCLGSLLGKNGKKLFPSISPNKSWAGAIGSVVFTLAAGACLYLLGFFPIKLWQWLIAAFIVVVFGIFGDLFESLVKRHYGVKDSGNIIAGHGGMWDRFDGALFAIPAVTVFFILTSII